MITKIKTISDMEVFANQLASTLLSMPSNLTITIYLDDSDHKKFAHQFDSLVGHVNNREYTPIAHHKYNTSSGISFIVKNNGHYSIETKTPQQQYDDYAKAWNNLDNSQYDDNIKAAAKHIKQAMKDLVTAYPDQINQMVLKIYDFEL